MAILVSQNFRNIHSNFSILLSYVIIIIIIIIIIIGFWDLSVSGSSVPSTNIVEKNRTENGQLMYWNKN